MTDGWTAWHRMARPDFVATLNQVFEVDRLGRARGEQAMTMPIVDPEPFAQKALPSHDSWNFFSPWIGKSTWENKVTVRSGEEVRAYCLPLSQISHIGPTPVFMTVALHDTNTAPDLGLDTFNRLSEPKELLLIDATHYDFFDKPEFIEMQIDFLKRTLL